jgi:signal peptidase I
MAGSAQVLRPVDMSDAAKVSGTADSQGRFQIECKTSGPDGSGFGQAGAGGRADATGPWARDGIFRWAQLRNEPPPGQVSPLVGQPSSGPDLTGDRSLDGEVAEPPPSPEAGGGLPRRGATPEDDPAVRTVTVARLDRSGGRGTSPIFYDDLAEPEAEGERRAAEVTDAVTGQEGVAGTAATSVDLTCSLDAEGSPSEEDAETEPAKPRRRRRGSFWRELPVLVGVALVLALIIKAFVVQAFYIPSQSMENTLKVGDRVLVNKFVYRLRPIHRGDVVVFNGMDSWDSDGRDSGPANPVTQLLESVGGFFGLVPGERDYIKRVIGVGGDHVQCAGRGAPVVVNGRPLDERSYLHPGNSPSSPPFDIIVPRGRLWVMGDHRDVSADSRYHRGGPGGGTIPAGKVVGRAFVVVWPISRWKTLSIPATFDQAALAGPAISGAPFALGLAAAVPLTFLYRRLRRLSRPVDPGRTA